MAKIRRNICLTKEKEAQIEASAKENGLSFSTFLTHCYDSCNKLVSKETTSKDIVSYLFKNRKKEKK